ncbi:DUF2330 domain-containing protein [Streptomyces sp. NPDC056361]|uniref:DUF2330 domain-containing protein n=1 Tax=Streptomyces sp. NPDC056361 TaxID=3345795 RepID=UPI0035DCC1F4
MRGTHGSNPATRILTTLIALLALQLGSLVAPAYACGCGAMIPDKSERIGVDREESAVHWDGRTETVAMRFDVHGNARKAAWIMPVPSRAEVTLGESALFDALASLTAPEERDRYYFWPREGDWPFDNPWGDGAAGAAPAAPGPGVGVVGRGRLGPFDVARLTATDPEALGDWLHANGFELPERLPGALQPYVDRKWEYVAVRIAPEENGAALHGNLTPLRIRFASPELVYPMRLSRLAATPQTLGLYILADHRMEPRSAIGGDRPEVTFAGRIAGDESHALALFTGGTPVRLTALEQRFPHPERIDDDHHLRAVADTPYREVVYTDRLLTVGDGIPAWLLTAGGGLLLAALTTLLAVRAKRRRSRLVAGVRSAA